MASLPPEILDEIFLYIQAGMEDPPRRYDDSVILSPDLARCARVCKRWNRVATRVLWRVSHTSLYHNYDDDVFSWCPCHCGEIRQPNLLEPALTGHSLERLQFLANEIEVMEFGHSNYSIPGEEWMESEYLAVPQSKNDALKELVGKFSKLKFPRLKTLRISRTCLGSIACVHDIVRNLLAAPKLVDLDLCKTSLWEQIHREAVKHCRYLHCFRMGSFSGAIPEENYEDVLELLSSFCQLKQVVLKWDFKSWHDKERAKIMETLAVHRGVTRILGVSLDEIADSNVDQKTTKALLSRLDAIRCNTHRYIKAQPQDWLPFTVRLEHISLTIYDTAMDWFGRSVEIAQLKTLELEFQLDLYLVGPQVLYDMLCRMPNLEKLRIFHGNSVRWVLPGRRLTLETVLPIVHHIQDPGNFPQLRIFDEDFSKPPQLFIRWDGREEVIWGDFTRWSRAGTIWSSESICRYRNRNWQKEWNPLW